MRKAFNRIAAGVTAVATVGTMFLTVAPAQAVGLTSTKDTLSREKVSVASVAHTLVTTLPTVSTGTVIQLDYETPGFSSLSQNGATGSCASGTCTLTVSATGVLITCTSGPCSGLFTQSGTWTGTNPGSAGSKSITYAQTSGDPVSGTFAIPIVDDDQVTVTATVSPSITFDIDTATTDTESAAPYTVPLGALTTAAVSGSDGSINSIWLDLDTNASGGAVITVLSANSSLKSTAVPGDTIPSASAQMSAGTANYGLCVSTLTTSTGSATSVSPFTDVQCDTTPAGNIVGGLTGSTQNLITTTAAVTAMRARILVDAAITALTAAHNDYTDTLTFIATGTF